MQAQPANDIFDQSNHNYQNSNGTSFTPDQAKKPAAKEESVIKKLLIVLIPFALIITLIFVLVNCTFSGPKAALDTYIECILEGKNPEKLAELVIDPVQKEHFIDNGIYESEEEMIAPLLMLSDTIEEAEEQSGEELKYEYKIEETYKYSKDEIEAVGEFFEGYYRYGYEADDIEDLVIYKIDFTLSMGEEEHTANPYIAVIKIRGKWYINTVLTDELVQRIADYDGDFEDFNPYDVHVHDTEAVNQ